jgi:hypothetical protein
LKDWRFTFRIGECVAALRKLHQKYRDPPMSVADACVVQLSRRQPACQP